jgi:hypothetical protein
MPPQKEQQKNIPPPCNSVPEAPTFIQVKTFRNSRVLRGGKGEGEVEQTFSFVAIRMSNPSHESPPIWIHSSEHGLINYIDSNAKCRHLYKFTCKGTSRQVFIRVYRLEIQSVMLVFRPSFLNCCPSNLLSGSPPPPPSFPL